ncbi:conserved hypothetical protein [Theileria orientalis strain Shintoku]|uniref:Uncharacterized protein n=1 Tax=Theileria orientalis strain Shintoku TaxID=869250 RepID=J4C3Z3_THEOR|nr:conserved hypothetical protein [Theileria orientalis strain Shintoku]BAM41286.1 conserved hypothetical protein [Theileria orientalis strain Shintoku]|eukprot:XP_009691587.1 conserved hypothetical protein [Theileria orientalis strain Shintoku]
MKCNTNKKILGRLLTLMVISRLFSGVSWVTTVSAMDSDGKDGDGEKGIKPSGDKKSNLRSFPTLMSLNETERLYQENPENSLEQEQECAETASQEDPKVEREEAGEEAVGAENKYKGEEQPVENVEEEEALYESEQLRRSLEGQSGGSKSDNQKKDDENDKRESPVLKSTNQETDEASEDTSGLDGENKGSQDTNEGKEQVSEKEKNQATEPEKESDKSTKQENKQEGGSESSLKQEEVNSTEKDKNGTEKGRIGSVSGEEQQHDDHEHEVAGGLGERKQHVLEDEQQASVSDDAQQRDHDEEQRGHDIEEQRSDLEQQRDDHKEQQGDHDNGKQGNDDKEIEDHGRVGVIEKFKKAVRRVSMVESLRVPSFVVPGDVAENVEVKTDEEHVGVTSEDKVLVDIPVKGEVLVEVPVKGEVPVDVLVDVPVEDKNIEECEVRDDRVACELDEISQAQARYKEYEQVCAEFYMEKANSSILKGEGEDEQQGQGAGQGQVQGTEEDDEKVKLICCTPKEGCRDSEILIPIVSHELELVMKGDDRVELDNARLELVKGSEDEEPVMPGGDGDKLVMPDDAGEKLVTTDGDGEVAKDSADDEKLVTADDDEVFLASTDCEDVVKHNEHDYTGVVTRQPERLPTPSEVLEQLDAMLQEHDKQEQEEDLEEDEHWKLHEQRELECALETAVKLMGCGMVRDGPVKTTRRTVSGASKVGGSRKVSEVTETHGVTEVTETHGVTEVTETHGVTEVTETHGVTEVSTLGKAGGVSEPCETSGISETTGQASETTGPRGVSGTSEVSEPHGITEPLGENQGKNNEEQHGKSNEEGSGSGKQDQQEGVGSSSRKNSHGEDKKKVHKTNRNNIVEGPEEMIEAVLGDNVKIIRSTAMLLNVWPVDYGNSKQVARVMNMELVDEENLLGCYYKIKVRGEEQGLIPMLIERKKIRKRAIVMEQGKVVYRAPETNTERLSRQPRCEWPVTGPDGKNKHSRYHSPVTSSKETSDYYRCHLEANGPDGTREYPRRHSPVTSSEAKKKQTGYISTGGFKHNPRDHSPVTSSQEASDYYRNPVVRSTASYQSPRGFKHSEVTSSQPVTGKTKYLTPFTSSEGINDYYRYQSQRQSPKSQHSDTHSRNPQGVYPALYKYLQSANYSKQPQEVFDDKSGKIRGDGQLKQTGVSDQLQSNTAFKKAMISSNKSSNQYQQHAKTQVVYPETNVFSYQLPSTSTSYGKLSTATSTATRRTEAYDDKLPTAIGGDNQTTTARTVDGDDQMTTTVDKVKSRKGATRRVDDVAITIEDDEDIDTAMAVYGDDNVATAMAVADGYQPPTANGDNQTTTARTVDDEQGTSTIGEQGMSTIGDDQDMSTIGEQAIVRPKTPLGYRGRRISSTESSETYSSPSTLTTSRESWSPKSPIDELIRVDKVTARLIEGPVLYRIQGPLGGLSVLEEEEGAPKTPNNYVYFHGGFGKKEPKAPPKRPKSRLGYHREGKMKISIKATSKVRRRLNFDDDNEDGKVCGKESHDGKVCGKESHEDMVDVNQNDDGKVDVNQNDDVDIKDEEYRLLEMEEALKEITTSDSETSTMVMSTSSSGARIVIGDSSDEDTECLRSMDEEMTNLGLGEDEVD